MSIADDCTLRPALDALPDTRQAWTTRRCPATAKPDAISRAPREAEPATTSPLSALKIATSQSPEAATNWAATEPAAGIVTVCCA